MIEIYGAPWCNWCDKAEQLMHAHALGHISSNVDFPEIKQELKERVEKEGIPLKDGKLTIPQIWWDNRYVGGYEAFASEVENLGNYGQGSV